MIPVVNCNNRCREKCNNTTLFVISLAVENCNNALSHFVILPVKGLFYCNCLANQKHFSHYYLAKIMATA